MLGAREVLCLCPAGRFYLVPVVLTTWTDVRRFVLTEDADHDLTGFDAVIVMDRFVERDLIERLSRVCPVIVLAWNGQFEIERYQADLDGIDVVYMGTDVTGPPGVRYLPTINGACSFVRWQELSRTKRQFDIHGNARYRLRWLRTKLFGMRALCVVLSASAAAIKRPRTALATLRSAVIRDRLVWAGNCQYDETRVELAPAERSRIASAVRSLRDARTPNEQLRAGLDLVAGWRNVIRPTSQHETLYITNTAMRWAVLAFLISANKSATWFFGVDNVDLGLPFELDVYNLVSNRRTAFVDFGGKTSETLLYPRSLQLLGRDCYVIGLTADDTLGSIVEHLRAEVSSDSHQLFEHLEQRRRDIYETITPSTTLAEVQQRVWSDFRAYLTGDESSFVRGRDTV